MLTALAAGPAMPSSSRFSNLASDPDTNPEVAKACKDAAESMRQFENARAKVALEALGDLTNVETRPTLALQFHGHLFDKQVINRVLDMSVDSQCEFKLTDLRVPQTNEGTSSFKVLLWAEKEEHLSHLEGDLEALIQACRRLAECHMCRVTEISKMEDPEAATAQKETAEGAKAEG